MNVAPDQLTESGFTSLLSEKSLVEVLSAQNIVTPTPVQAQVIPLLQQGRDIIAQAKTGSGKTLAFVLPMLEKLGADSPTETTLALVLTPTRELATQITEVTRSLSSISPVCVIGGVSFDSQRRALDQDRRVIVGTPGRILDLLRQRTISLRKVEYFVVDEADEMFSMDFVEDVRAILSRLPEKRQGTFASATITPRVESLANSFLSKPERIIIQTEGEAMPQIEHLFCEVSGEVSAKPLTLCDILETERPRSALIFCNTKSDTELVEAYLRRRGHDARLINSDLTQKQRDRVMAMIKNQELQYLIGTDIAARGIDIEELALVVNYGIPEQPEAYIHRTGRTGRAGKSGRAISLIGPQDFGPFQGLKRAVPVDLKPLPVPTEEAVISARISHLLELLRESKIDPQPRELVLAKKLMVQLGVEEPTEELIDLMGKLYRFTLEHWITHGALSLDAVEAEPQEKNDEFQRERPPHGGSRRHDSHRRGDRRHGGGHGGGGRRHGGGRGHR